VRAILLAATAMLLKGYSEKSSNHLQSNFVYQGLLLFGIGTVLANLDAEIWYIPFIIGIALLLTGLWRTRRGETLP
jgi:hypothetical protein